MYGIDMQETSTYETQVETARSSQPISSLESSSTSRSESQSQDSTPSSTSVKLRSLDETYARCHMCVVELESYQEATHDQAWQEVKTAEIKMIEKKNDI